MKDDLSFNLRHFLANEIAQMAEILEKTGLFFQDFWRRTNFLGKIDLPSEIWANLAMTHHGEKSHAHVWFVISQSLENQIMTTLPKVCPNN